MVPPEAEKVTATVVTFTARMWPRVLLTIGWGVTGGAVVARGLPPRFLFAAPPDRADLSAVTPLLAVRARRDAASRRLSVRHGPSHRAPVRHAASQGVTASAARHGMAASRADF